MMIPCEGPSPVIETKWSLYLASPEAVDMATSDKGIAESTNPILEWDDLGFQSKSMWDFDWLATPTKSVNEVYPEWKPSSDIIFIHKIYIATSIHNNC